MRMTFHQPGACDANETGIRLELLDSMAAAVTHARAQAARHLIDRIGKQPLIWDSPFDPLGHKLLLFCWK